MNWEIFVKQTREGIIQSTENLNRIKSLSWDNGLLPPLDWDLKPPVLLVLKPSHSDWN